MTLPVVKLTSFRPLSLFNTTSQSWGHGNRCAINITLIGFPVDLFVQQQPFGSVHSTLTSCMHCLIHPNLQHGEPHNHRKAGTREGHRIPGGFSRWQTLHHGSILNSSRGDVVIFEGKDGPSFTTATLGEPMNNDAFVWEKTNTHTPVCKMKRIIANHNTYHSHPPKYLG